MKPISHGKHPVPKSPAPQAPPEFFPTLPGGHPTAVAPLSTAAALAPLFDFPTPAACAAHLRTLERTLHPDTGQPFLDPKHRARSRWNTAEAIRAVLRHREHRATIAEAQYLPKTLASMTDFTARFGLALEAIKKIRQSGKCPDAFHASNRVNTIPLIRYICEVASKLFATGGPDLQAIDGLETVDREQEQGRKFRAERLRIEKEEQIRDRTLILDSEAKKYFLETIIKPILDAQTQFRRKARHTTTVPDLLEEFEKLQTKTAATTTQLLNQVQATQTNGEVIPAV